MGEGGGSTIGQLGRVSVRSSDESRAVLKRVDLMEEFFENVHRQIRTAGI